MSCYLRHMKGIISRAGIELAGKEERKALDMAVREVLGVGSAPCNEVWREAKVWLSQPGNEDILVEKLRRKLK